MKNSSWYTATIRSRVSKLVVAVAMLGVSGSFVNSAQSADLILGSSSSREFAATAPKRILDTRSGLGGAGHWALVRC